MVYVCCVEGCYTKDFHNIGFRSFPPIDTELFEQWKVATMNESLKNLDDMYIRKRKKVCNLHFSEKYRKRPCFLRYDYPKLTENIVKVNDNKQSECSTAAGQKYNSSYKLVNLDHTYCSTITEFEGMNVFNDSIGITDNKHVDLDQSCSKTEVVAKDAIIIDDSNKITGNNPVNLDLPYSKTVGVEDKATNIVDNNNRITVVVNKQKINIYDERSRIISSKIVNLDQPYTTIVKVNNENDNVVNKSINIVENNNRNTVTKLVKLNGKMVKVKAAKLDIVENSNGSAGSKCVNFGQPCSKLEKVTNVKMNVDDNNDGSTGSKLANFYQSYGQTIEEEIIDKSVVDEMNSQIRAAPVKKIIYLKNEQQMLSSKRRKLRKRVSYLEKINRKHKEEMKLFGNFKKLDQIVQNFFKCQMSNAGKKCRGETYSFQDKLFALGIYNQSKACYKYLLRFFSLPSFTTVLKFYNRIKNDPHFLNVNIFNEMSQHFDETNGIEEKLADCEKHEYTEPQ